MLIDALGEHVHGSVVGIGDHLRYELRHGVRLSNGEFARRCKWDVLGVGELFGVSDVRIEDGRIRLGFLEVRDHDDHLEQACRRVRIVDVDAERTALRVVYEIHRRRVDVPRRLLRADVALDGSG